MKKYIGLVFPLLFPYILAVAFLPITVNEDWFYYMMWHYAILWAFGALLLLSLVFSILTCVIAVKKEWEGQEAAKVNMIIKLCQIPAYIINLVFAVIAAVGFFMAAPIMLLIFFAFDCIAIFFTGLIGMAASIRCFKEGKLTKRMAIVLTISQFIFCIDVIASIVLWRKSKRINSQETSQN